jgi:GTPase SAR1 family protein
VGNQIDLEERQVQTAEIREFAKENSCDSIAGSAKTGKNVGDAFAKMAEVIVAAMNEL